MTTLTATIVQVVHDITRDAIAQICGAITSYLLEAVLTLGVALPWIIEQVATRVASMTTRIGRHIDDLITSFAKLRGLLDDLAGNLRGLGEAFDRFVRGAAGPQPALAAAGGPVPHTTGPTRISVDSAGTERTSLPTTPDTPARPRSVPDTPASRTGPTIADVMGDPLTGAKPRTDLPAPDVPGARPGPAITALQRQKLDTYDRLIERFAKVPWLVRVFDGSRFNIERAHAYTYNEVSVTRPGGGRPFRVDSYTPNEAIVSRKVTQFAEIDPATARRYIDEARNKYPPRTDGVTIADTNGNRTQLSDNRGIIGERLDGRLVLEVPTQNAPIPQQILEHARQRKVRIVEAPRIR